MKSAVKFWWLQRVTALLIFPFFVYLVFSVVAAVKSGDLMLVVSRHPFALFCFFSLLLYHGAIGVQVIIEDYISKVFLREAFITSIYAISILTSVAIVFVLIKAIA